MWRGTSGCKGGGLKYGPSPSRIGSPCQMETTLTTTTTTIRLLRQLITMWHHPKSLHLFFNLFKLQSAGNTLIFYPFILQFHPLTNLNSPFERIQFWPSTNVNLNLGPESLPFFSMFLSFKVRFIPDVYPNKINYLEFTRSCFYSNLLIGNFNK